MGSEASHTKGELKIHQLVHWRKTFNVLGPTLEKLSKVEVVSFTLPGLARLSVIVLSASEIFLKVSRVLRHAVVHRQLHQRSFKSEKPMCCFVSALADGTFRNHNHKQQIGTQTMSNCRVYMHFLPA